MERIPTPKDLFPAKKATKKRPYKVKPHLTHRPFLAGLSKYDAKKTKEV